MEPLHNMICKATEVSLLSPLWLRDARHRSSFYADDAALFINPVKDDMIAIENILHVFGSISEIKANLSKCVAYPTWTEGGP
jgi:hypothetical protein